MRRLATLTLILAFAPLAATLGQNPETEARALFDKASKAMKTNDFKTAAEHLRKAVKLQPKNDTYVGNLGYVEAMLGNIRAALEYSEKAIALNDRVFFYHANAGAYAYQLREHEKALKHSEKALTFGKEKLGEKIYNWTVTIRDRSRCAPFVDKAHAEQKAGRLTNAVEQMKKAVALAPSDSDTLATLAWMESLAGNYSDGLAHIEKAIALNDKTAWFYSTAAFNAHGAEEFTRARNYARKALTFPAADLGAEATRKMRELLADFRPRTYTIRWKLDPSKGHGENGKGKGPFHVPVPTTDLPFQKATYTVTGAQSHKLVTKDGADLLMFEADGNKPVEISASVTVRFHDYRPKIKTEKTAHYPDEARAFLGAGPCLDPASKKVQAILAKVKGDTPRATVHNLLAWLKKNMTYKHPSTFKSADEVIDRGYGDCGAYSAVFVAVCRAAGIPAREVWGVVKTTPQFAPAGHMASHVWAEVYVNGAGWVPVEPQYPNGFGHMPLAYVRMMVGMTNGHKWPNAMIHASGALSSMNGKTPRYEEKLLPEDEK